MTPEREAMYKDARKRAQQILDICDAILESKVTEARACQDMNLPIASFRSFCKNHFKSPDKIHVCEEDWDDWREKLLNAITDETVPAPDDFDEVFEELCKTELSERRVKVLRMYFEDGLGYEEIGKDIGVTRERIRQILVTTLRILRRPDRRNRLVYGAHYCEILKQKRAEQAKYDQLWLEAQKNAAEQKNAKIEALQRETDALRAANKVLESTASTTPSSIPTLEEHMKQTSIDELDLSVRSSMCLKRYFGCCGNVSPTAWDVAHLSCDTLMHVRNLGRKSFEEITSRILDLFGPGFPITES